MAIPQCYTVSAFYDVFTKKENVGTVFRRHFSTFEGLLYINPFFRACSRLNAILRALKIARVRRKAFNVMDTNSDPIPLWYSPHGRLPFHAKAFRRRTIIC